MSTSTELKKKLVDKYIKLVLKLGVYPTFFQIEQSGLSESQIRRLFGSLEGLRKAAIRASKGKFKSVDEKLAKDKEAERAKLILIYATLAFKAGSHLSLAQLSNAGISESKVKYNCVNLGTLQQQAEKAYPEKFAEINKKKEPHPLSDFTKESLGEIVKEHNHRQGIFFVTAVSPVNELDYTEEDLLAAKKGDKIIGHNLHKEAFAAVGNFLKRHSANLVLLPMPAHVKALHNQPRHYDPDLLEYKSKFVTEYVFNAHLKAIEAYINPQQINPLTGLKRLRVHRLVDDNTPGAELKKVSASLIVGHAKQMMDTTPTGNSTTPRIIHSTGTICKASYLRNRVGLIADVDHKLGGLIVEIQGDVFYVRQVQMDPVDGSFVDMGVRYHADGRVTSERAEAFKIGDIHPGYHNSKALKAMYSLWNFIAPKRVFFEDFFDGSSISHHLERKKLSRAKLPSYFGDLPTEIEMAKGVLTEIQGHAPKDSELIATASNHPEHVMRYLEEGRYIGDNAANYALAHRMVVLALDNKNPLQEYLDPSCKMRWTNENDDYLVEGVQMNCHGHLGINGSKGSRISHELAYGDSMPAHSHTPSIYHNTFTIGHMSADRHGYNNGSSSWMLCCGAVYKGGQKQLYMIVRGRVCSNRMEENLKRLLSGK